MSHEDDSAFLHGSDSDVSTQSDDLADTAPTSLASSAETTCHGNELAADEPKVTISQTDSPEITTPAHGHIEPALSDASQHAENVPPDAVPTGTTEADKDALEPPSRDEAAQPDASEPVDAEPDIMHPPSLLDPYPYAPAAGPVLAAPTAEQTSSMLYSLKEDFRDRYDKTLLSLPGDPSVAPAAPTLAREQAPLRVLQYQEYVGHMEDRVKFLESELAAMKAVQAIKAGASDRDIDDTMPPSVSAALASRSSADQAACKIHPLESKQFLLGDELSKYVICTLAEDQESYSTAGRVNTASTHAPHTSGHLSRISIRSRHILDLFLKYLPEGSALEYRATMFIKPFKPIYVLEKHIRSYASVLHAEKLRRAEMSPESIVDSEQDPPIIGPITLEKELLDMARKLKDDDLPVATDHIDLLVTLLDGPLKPQLDRHQTCQEMTASKPFPIYYDDLWHLFKPGNIVYAEQPNQQAYMVVNVRGGRRVYRPEYLDDPSLSLDKPTVKVESKSFSTFTVDCVYLDTDGNNLDFVSKTLEIPYFSQSRDINGLPVVPIEYAVAPNGESCKDYLLKRGTNFVKLTAESYAHRDYAGPSLPDTDSLSGKAKPREQIDSQVIVDFEQAYLNAGLPPSFSIPIFPEPNGTELPDSVLSIGLCALSTCTNPYCPATTVAAYDDIKINRRESREMLALLTAPESSESISDIQKMILPGHVYGYVLRMLDWYKLDVNLLKNPSQGASFDDLVLPLVNKDLVKALVSSRKNARNPDSHTIDVVRGKGQGIIVLLHGVPGTGKSSTAECVAEHLGCPLFTITCGNIGVKAPEVQKSLQNMFYMAQRWDCVMLLDEADVFLQERDTRDIERNAVVSVFLRALEYFGGVLFLTTNKVGKFDEAFVSRIHQAIEYPPLDLEATKAIWKVNLRKLREARPQIEFNDNALESLAEHIFRQQKGSERGVTWNGRQIRNAFQTASALAEHSTRSRKFSVGGSEAVRISLTEQHFLKVLDVSDAFDQYLKETRGDRDQFDLAREAQDRVDPRKRQNQPLFSSGISRNANQAYYGTMQAASQPYSMMMPGQNSVQPQGMSQYQPQMVPNQMYMVPTTGQPIQYGQGHYQGQNGYVQAQQMPTAQPIGQEQYQNNMLHPGPVPGPVHGDATAQNIQISQQQSFPSQVPAGSVQGFQAGTQGYVAGTQ